MEIRASGHSSFSVLELLGPTINSCGVITLAAEKHASYRVQAFYEGSPSNMAHQTTASSSSP